MMIPIQLQMFASSLALMAQLFVLFLPSLRPLVARRAYWATQVLALTFDHGVVEGRGCTEKQEVKQRS